MGEPAFYVCKKCGKHWERYEFKMQRNPPRECPSCGAGPDDQVTDRQKEDAYVGAVYKPLVEAITRQPMVKTEQFAKDARPRNYPVPDEIEQVLVRCCDDCPCLVVEDDKLCSLMPPETEGTDRRGRKFIVQHEITVDTSEQVDPECPLKKKHHILMLSTMEE
jgi:DNA-directed RNA polymerase subunit RPC12/RpoP